MNKEETKVFVDIWFSVSGLSFLSAIWSLLTIVILKLHKRRLTKLIIPVHFVDLIHMSPLVFARTFWPVEALQGIYCQVVGFFLTFGSAASCLWQMAIAIWMLLLVYRLQHPPLLLDKFLHIIWAISIFLASIGFLIAPVGDFYVPVDGNSFCWISERFANSRFILYYFWVYVSMPLLFFSYLAILLKSQKNCKSDEKKILFGKLMGYPIIYIILWTPLVINRTVQMFHQELPDWFTMLSLTIAALPGFLNAIYYTITRKVLLKLKEKIFRDTPQSQSLNRVDQLDPK